jgi:ketosteroid isomerase-like protein
MKSSGWLFVVTTILAASTWSCGQSTTKPAADKDKVTQVGERELAALNSGSIDANLGAMTDDVVLMPPNEPTIIGAAAMRDWLQRGHEQFKFDIQYTDSQVDIAGDWAIQRYAIGGSLTPKAGGAPVEARGKGIHIYRRQRDGSWLIAQDIWNDDAAAPPHP